MAITSKYSTTYSKMRWYAERKRLAIVSKDSKASTVDDMYVNVPSGSQIRIYGAKIPDHFTETNDTLPELPEQFHEAIVYKAISMGYEVPPNLNPELAMYFKAQYEEKVKSAKKWKKQSRVGGPRFMRPMDY
tara:strand:+ start:112 stop:507 length:396 start_codon:yes stop_codon:yes gene_type:complete